MKKLKLSIIGFSVLAGSLTLGFAGSSGWSSSACPSRAGCARGECGSRAMMQYAGRMMDDSSRMQDYGDRGMYSQDDRSMRMHSDRPMHDRMMHNRSMDDRGMRDMQSSSGRMMDDSAWQGSTGGSAGYRSGSGYGSGALMNPGTTEVDEEIVDVDME